MGTTLQSIVLCESVSIDPELGRVDILGVHNSVTVPEFPAEVELGCIYFVLDSDGRAGILRIEVSGPGLVADPIDREFGDMPMPRVLPCHQQLPSVIVHRASSFVVRVLWNGEECGHRAIAVESEESES